MFSPENKKAVPILFGRTSLFGIDMGFWVAMSAVLLIVIVMNVVFWGMKPKAGHDASGSK